ncbi:hypothetical protein HWV62_12787 [Athelia sp. TMB]|nr:hypothetical protein HWV62_12787 [Athelia sp. TMB]
MKREFWIRYLIKYPKQCRLSEPWAARQRWRAITANATSAVPQFRRLEDLAQVIEQEVIALITWAYGQSSRAMIDDAIYTNLLRDIHAIVRDAHQLSLVLKRDILSSEMSVSLDDRVNKSYDPQKADNVWPEMGSKAGDTIIGVYGFGLRKIAPNGQSVQVIKPKVTTSALLRNLVAKG